MTYEYKWYVTKVYYNHEQNVRELVSGAELNLMNYFKDVFIPCKVVYNFNCSVDVLSDVYVNMHLCDESENILSKVSGFHSFCEDEFGNFKTISSGEIDLKYKEVVDYSWYILRTAVNCEERIGQYILENIEKLGINCYFKEVFIPYEELSDKELKSKKSIVRRKHFPGYVFLNACLSDKVLNFINNIPKSLRVYGFLRDSNFPKVISSGEIDLMRNALVVAGENKKLSYSYEKGEKVKVIDGLFQSFIGKIDSVSETEKMAYVEVSILGKSTIIELNLNQVERVEG